MLPSFVAYLLNINVINWFYITFNSRRSKFIKSFKYVTKPKLIKSWSKFEDALKATIIFYWLYLIVCGVLKLAYKVLKLLFKIIIMPFFGKRTRQAAKRYLGIARHATYITQAHIFTVLRRAYPNHFSFVVLAMDMEFMDAGQPKKDYYSQLEDLIALKEDYPKELHAFIAIDPRRLQYSKKANFNFEDYALEHFKNGNFSGVKLYPALGYYPFDKRFKNIYKFCVNNNVPIMSHCIEGTIYYRGSKTKERAIQVDAKSILLNNKKEWQEHPILKVNRQKESLKLPQKRNHDFSKNFGHPFNYKCLLDPKKASEYFGEPVDFSKLKICLAHFGGSEEWDKYFEDTYQTYNNNLFIDDNIGKATAYTNAQNIWDNASWLSVIYDLMCEYENVYADMSFMLYNKNNFNLLKLLIDDKRVGHKILFGTDFYVVAQKGTEKRLYHTIRAELGEERFEKVSVTNARTYLSSSYVEI